MRKKITPYLFIGPHFLLFSVFFMLPVGLGIYYSLTKWNMIGAPEFVGLSNYATLLFQRGALASKRFWNGMWNSLQFTIYALPFLVSVSLMLAVFLSYRPRGHSVMQAVFYLPGLFSVATVGLMWLRLLDARLGPVNLLLGISVAWTAHQPFTWIALVMMTVWWTIGANMVIFVAGIHDIDPNLYESAAIDGAGEVRKFLHITVPQLKNQFVYILILTLVACLNVFGQPLMFSKGGPSDSTKSIIMYIREAAFGQSVPQAGMASAMSLLLGITVFGISLIQHRVLTRRGEG